MGHTSGVGVLDKAATLLEAVATEPLTLATMTERTGVSRATAHRLACALEVHRLLGRDAQGRWVLGDRLHELGHRAVGVGEELVVAHAAPVLVRLRDQTGESAQLYLRRGDARVCVAVAERASGLRDTVPVGSALPMTAGSAAQVLLAWEPPATVAGLLDRARFSARTLAEVRRRGWAQTAAEREAGVGSVSAPVRDAHGAVVAAISVSGPLDRLGRAPGRRHAAPVVAAGRDLSRLVGSNRVSRLPATSDRPGRLHAAGGMGGGAPIMHMPAAGEPRSRRSVAGRQFVAPTGFEPALPP